MKWITFMGVNSSIEYEKLKRICEDTYIVDKTFDFMFTDPKGKLAGKYHKILRVFSKDKDTAHKRGMWLKYKTFMGECWKCRSKNIEETKSEDEWGEHIVFVCRNCGFIHPSLLYWVKKQKQGGDLNGAKN